MVPKLMKYSILCVKNKLYYEIFHISSNGYPNTRNCKNRQISSMILKMSNTLINLSGVYQILEWYLMFLQFQEIFDYSLIFLRFNIKVLSTRLTQNIFRSKAN
jgi:hypothetical protein